MNFRLLGVATAALLLPVIAGAQSQVGSADVKHVLLLSVDGMHAVDLRNCTHGMKGVNGGEPYCPNLAALTTSGVNYTAAETSKPSDSFPGLMALVTGATPKTMGVYYDVAYDRSLDAPAATTGNGVAGGAMYGVWRADGHNDRVRGGDRPGPVQAERRRAGSGVDGRRRGFD